MYDCMAVRAQRYQIGYWIELVFRADRAQGDDVMNMDKPSGDLAVDLAEV